MMDLVVNSAFQGLREYNRIQFGNHFNKIKGLIGKSHLPCLYLGHIQDIVDQGQQISG